MGDIVETSEYVLHFVYADSQNFSLQMSIKYTNMSKQAWWVITGNIKDL